jgi:amino acid adenylation domain-containing protein
MTRVNFEISGDLFSRLTWIINESDERLFIILTTVLEVLLHHYTGNEDIIIGAPIYKQDIEGDFINTVLILRNRVEPGKTLKELLLQVRNTINEAVENQNYPIKAIFYDLNLTLQENDCQLFDTVVLLENVHYRKYIETVNYNILFSFLRTPRAVQGVVEYKTHLFEQADISRIISHLLHLMAQVLFKVDIPIGEVDWVPAEEKEQLLVEFNDNKLAYPKTRTVHEIFEEQVKRTPDRLAVVVEGKHLTYRELNERANYLARVLEMGNVGPDGIVGLMAKRSLEMIVGIFGILKAGGAYLPIDPVIPMKRIHSLLEESQSSTLLLTDDIIEDYSYTAFLNNEYTEIKYVQTPPRQSITNLDSLPFPDRSLVDYEKYNQYIGQALVKNRMVLQSTRGCPYNCAFCHKIWPKNHVARSAENIFAEIQLYYRMGVRRFSFIDDIFNLNMTNTRKLFELIIKNGLDVRLFLILRGDILTGDYIDLMVKAGVTRASMSLETASERLQKLIGKNLNLKKFRENAEYFCREYPQVILEMSTLHGIPTETEQEARMTLDFFKSLHWVHFPYIHVLKIYPNTDMEKIALENGVSREDIARSTDLAYHELPETLPFNKNFSKEYQAEFFNDYFLLKERLLHVLPHQMKILTEDEMVQKYDSYLPVDINSLEGLLTFVGIERHELRTTECLDEASIFIPDLNQKLERSFPGKTPSEDALRVLLLDFSQLFTTEKKILYDVVEPPLGLMYILSYLNRQFPTKINGRIAKSRIDFDSYTGLKAILDEFKPMMIGVRTLTFFKEFFHKSIALIRQWGFTGPIIAGGPYVSSDYLTILPDHHIDILVLGEGEITFSEVMEKVIDNKGQLPDEAILKEIPGLVFVPTSERNRNTAGVERKIIVMEQAISPPVVSPGLEAGKPNPICGPGNLAYVMFTSGSTGRPRGVLIEHRSVNNLAAGLRERIYRHYEPGTRVGLLAPYTFDASVKQIFGALLSGHTLVIVPEDCRTDGLRLLDFYRKYQVEIVDCTPTHMRLFRENGRTSFPGLPVKHVIIGGEALDSGVAQQLLKMFQGNRSTANSQLKITNVYGPTECCDVSTTYDVSPQDLRLRVQTPIGKPLPNVRVFIVSSGGRLQPLGVVGELYIGGDGLARGYMANPVANRQKFTLEYFAQEERIYRSGDLARWLADGNIEFVGRKDRQIKIRGYRIEPGEIENRLKEIEDIQEVVVISRADGAGDNCLCAYIVSVNDDLKGLREYLAKRLPEFLIPSYFIPIEKIPLTANGKIDHKALPEPETAEAGEDFEAAGNWLEERLVDIWSGVLMIEKENISVSANFWDLGGHSLRATSLVARIDKVFNTRLALIQVFRTPTIKELAEYLKGILPESDEEIKPVEKEKIKEARLVFIEPVEKKEYYPLSSAQARFYILHQLELGGILYNAPHIVEIEGKLDKEKFEDTFRKLIRRHESLRTSFEMINEEPVQKIHEWVNFAIEYYDLSGDGQGAAIEEGSEAETGRTSVIDRLRKFVRPFDLSRVPLLRVAVIITAEERYILIVDMHHIVTDGISNMVLIRDFHSLYAGEKLPFLRLQYKDYSQWQNNPQQKEIIRKQEEFWLKEFEGEIPVLNLPFDYPRPEMQSFEGNRVDFELDKKETKHLNNISKENDGTLYMSILSIFTILLAKLSGQEDIIVGTPIAARRHADLESIVGMFVNTLVMRNYPRGSKTFTEFFNEIKQRTLDAYENQEYQFEELVDKISIHRDTSRNPLFDVMFVLQNQGDQISVSTMGEASERSITEGNIHPVARFDIVFQAIEINDRIDCSIEYCTRLFKKETIDKFIGYFRNIISSVSQNPMQRLLDIEIMTEAGKKEILNISQGKKEEGEGSLINQTIHGLFEKKAREIPGNTAVVFNHESYSYEELNRRANQLAQKFRVNGVKPGHIVGIMVERSFAMIVGILAAMKAGAAYLPIGGEFPEKRVLDMLSDSRASILLTNESHLERFSITSLKGMKAGAVTPARTQVCPQITDFDRLPYPDRTLIDYEKYHHRIGIAMAKHTVSIQATRGCPYNCAFCHKIWPKKHVVRSAENIFQEIFNCYQAGVSRFVFIDDIFNLDIKNSTRLFKKIIQNRLDLQLFFPNGLRGDILTADFIDLMVEAGTVNIDLALESASPRIQKLIGKNLNLEKFKENVRCIAEKYPQVVLEIELIIGFPSETEEEALMTLEFLKALKWVHFPNLNVLKIYPNTDMYRLALENGIDEEAIQRSVNLAYHELPETLPFSKDFAREIQTRFMKEYFLSKERLLHVLPHQARNFTADEILQKYDSYLPMEIKGFSDILQLVDGDPGAQLTNLQFLPPHYRSAANFNENMKRNFPVTKKVESEDSFRILLVDLSQLFSTQSQNRLYDMVEEPLGLMYLLSYLNERFGHRVWGKVLKSRIDFDRFGELKTIISEFKPDLVGLRTLSLYREFFHTAVLKMREWGIDVPIIAGGPYSTSDYMFLLQDFNIDLAVIGEGELILAELVEKMMENNNKMPAEEVLKTIKGIAFIENKYKVSPGSFIRNVILADRLPQQLAPYPGEKTENIDNDNQVKDSNLVYMIYTSGSTGIPKGVMLEHRNVVNLMEYMFKYTNIDCSRILQFATISFDASFHEIFSALLSGGSLYLVNHEIRTNILELFAYIEKNEIKTIFLPMSFLRVIFNEDQFIAAFPRCVNHIQTAGEQVIVNDKFRKYLTEHHVYLHNHYGPSETHVVTALTLHPREEIPQLPSIGKPILNTDIYIVDKGNHLLPRGVPGELCIGGIQVGRGYLGKETLTKEKFIDNPFVEGDRLYKSGDLAKWLTNGNIEFLGRIDRQVKIRGFRVELGEIEKQLLNRRDIKEAVVAAREDNSKDKYLCAYIVSNDGLSVSELQEYLSGTLPNYMVPSYFVQLDEIPLTPTGKVDRKALPEPEAGIGWEEYTKPQNKIEEKLVEIWAELLILGKNKISTGANFFQLGGHSLRAIIMISQIHKEFYVRIPLAEIFRTPTIKGLAGYIKKLTRVEFQMIQIAEEKEYYRLSSAQKRLYVLQQLEPVSTAYNMTKIVSFREKLERKPLVEAFEKLAERHDNLRTSFELINDEPMQRVHHPQSVTFIPAYHKESNNEKGMIKDFIRPFNLAKAPILRVGVIEASSDRQILIVDMHHIISDGTSDDILVEEFIALYSGETLPPLKLCYKDYSEWLNNGWQKKALQEQEAYWLRIYSGEIPVLNLPTDYPRPPVQSFEGDTLRFQIGHQQTLQLKKIALEENVTTYMLMLTIFYVFLAKLSGQEDIIVGTDLEGRPHADLERVIGMFVNTLALRNFPGRNRTFREFLQEVRNRTLEAFENQGYPFDELVDKVGVKRDPSRNPLFDVMFASQGVDSRSTAGETSTEVNPGLSWTPYDYRATTAKFDLLLVATDVGDRIVFHLEYYTQLFKEETIESFIKSFQEIVSTVIPNQDIQLKNIIISHDLLSAQSALAPVEFGF